MRKVFSSNEPSETVLIRDALLHGGVAATIQNEYSGRTAVPEFRPPAEVWVTNDHDYDDARRIVVDALATIDGESNVAPWVCSNCHEQNPQSFDLCWNCATERS